MANNNDLTANETTISIIGFTGAVSRDVTAWVQKNLTTPEIYDEIEELVAEWELTRVHRVTVNGQEFDYELDLDWEPSKEDIKAHEEQGHLRYPYEDRYDF